MEDMDMGTGMAAAMVVVVGVGPGLIACIFLKYLGPMRSSSPKFARSE